MRELLYSWGPGKAGRRVGFLALFCVLEGAALLMPRLLSVLGTSGLLGYYAGGYLKAILPFFTCLVLTFILEQAVRNDGSPNLAGAVMALCALLNIALDYLFLFVLDFGIAGAAIASGISQSLGALVFVGYFLRKILKKAPGLRPAFPDLRFSTIRRICVNGSSEMFNSLSMGITTFLFNRLILAHVGPMGVAALTVVQYPVMLGVMIIMGIGNGAQPIFSYNHGAGRGDRVKGTLIRISAVSGLVGLLLFILMLLQAEAVAALFLPGHPDAVALTGTVSRLVSWSMLFMPLGMVFSVYFTALEQAGKSLLIALCRGLLLPVFGLAVFPYFIGVTGIWITPLFTEAAAFLVATGALILSRPGSRNRNHSGGQSMKATAVSSSM